MRPDSRLPLRPAVLWLFAFALSAGVGCRRASSEGWQGYFEAEYVRVASPLAGRLDRLEVDRGATVTAGQPLFALEAVAEEAALREATGRRDQARRRHEDLTKGRRPSELAAIGARRAQAMAARELAETELGRARRLLAEGAIAPSEFDRAQATFDRERQGLEAVEAELATARLGAREDEVGAAAAELSAAEAGMARAQWALDQKRQAASVSAWVQDTLYRPGEWVAAGSPVVSLLPPGHLKVRFYVPQPELARVRVGQSVRVRVDGRAEPMIGTVDYVSPEAEFTPPVIYSQENRAKLVFMVEAGLAPADAPGAHPGQPVEVAPVGEPGAK